MVAVGLVAVSKMEFVALVEAGDGLGSSVRPSVSEVPKQPVRFIEIQMPWELVAACIHVGTEFLGCK